MSGNQTPNSFLPGANLKTRTNTSNSANDHSTDDSGSISIAAAIVAVAFMFIAVALVSQQRYLSALSEVREVASNAARAAGQELDIEAQRAAGQVSRVDKKNAEEVALRIIADVEGMTLKSFDVDEDRVTVVVTTTVTAALGTKTFEAESSAVGLQPGS